jgi:hypothetical protein
MSMAPSTPCEREASPSAGSRAARAPCATGGRRAVPRPPRGRKPFCATPLQMPRSIARASGIRWLLPPAGNRRPRRGSRRAPGHWRMGPQPRRAAPRPDVEAGQALRVGPGAGAENPIRPRRPPEYRHGRRARARAAVAFRGAAVRSRHGATSALFDPAASAKAPASPGETYSPSRSAAGSRGDHRFGGGPQTAPAQSEERDNSCVASARPCRVIRGSARAAVARCLQ